MQNESYQREAPRPDCLLTTLEQLLAIDATEVKPAMQQVAQLIGEALNADKIDAFFYDPATHSLVALGSNESPMSRREKALALDRLQIANGGSAVGAFLTGNSFLNNHLDQNQSELPGIWAPQPQGLGVISQIAASIDVQGERRGVLMAASSTPEFFTEQDLGFLEATAHWIGIVMHRAELVERQTREAVAQGRRLAAEELLTIMAHDLKNYITPLRARLDLLRRRAKRQEHAENLRDIDLTIATLTRFDHMIGSLLDVARLDQGLFMLQTQTLNVVDMLRDAALTLSTQDVTIQIKGPEEVIIAADPERLCQALENLLANAVAHAPKQTPVTVHVRNVQREDGLWVVLSVHNQGPPIPSDLLAHLFQPFVAGSSSQGLGLGLYLARSIVDAHHGHLTVSSEETNGTQFIITLPTDQTRAENTDVVLPAERDTL